MLHFKKTGQGQSLIILHGLYGSSDNWIPIIKVFEKYFTVYAVDFRNHGKSPHFDSHNYTDLTNDIYSFIKENNIVNPIILGHSMGGKVAMFLAKQYTKLISKLIVVDVSPLPYVTEDVMTPELFGHKRIIKGLLSVNLNLVKSYSEIKIQLGSYIKDEKTILFLLKNIERTKSKFFKWRLNINILEKEIFNILDGFDKDLPLNIETQTLFLKGKESNYITEPDIEYIRNTFFNHNIVEISNSGHWIHAEQKDVFAQIILDYLLTK